MKSIADLKNDKTHLDLRLLSDFIKAAGVSKTFPKDETGKVSLPFAIALLCGAQPHHASDDFEYLLSILPSYGRIRFVNCWDSIEAEVGQDILNWSHNVDQDLLCGTLLSIATHIDLSQ